MTAAGRATHTPTHACPYDALKWTVRRATGSWAHTTLRHSLLSETALLEKCSYIIFFMLILIKKIIKVKNYVRNESTTAQLEGKLVNVFLHLQSIFNMQFFS